MPVASYNKPNDYSVVNFQPFKLDSQSVLKEAAVRQQFWMQGVQKIQSSWNAINDLDPLYTQNKTQLENFNKGVKEQITKLSRTDLSLSENSDQIRDIIKPLYDMNNPISKSILTDSQINKFYQAEFQKVEQSKLKDKGSEYSINNERYLRDQYNKYAKGADSNDPNAPTMLEEHWKNKQGYIPYYDYKKDMETAIKNCKNASHTNSSPVAGGYMKTETYSGITSECISASLPPKAFSQMKIDGYVGYKAINADGTDNFVPLQTDLVDVYNKNKTKNTENIAMLTARMAEKDPKKAPSAEDKIKYGTLLTQLTDQNTDIDKNISKLGDLNYIRDNYDNLANQSYTGKIMTQLDNVYDHVSTTYKEDHNQMLQQKMAFDNGQALRKLQFDAIESATQRIHEDVQGDKNRAVQMAKVNQDEKTNNPGLGLSLSSALGPDGKIEFSDATTSVVRTPESFRSEADQLLKQEKDVRGEIIEYAKQLNIAMPNNTPAEQVKLIQKLQENSQNDPDLAILLKKYQINDLITSVHNSEQNQIDAEKARRYSELDKKPIILNLSNGQAISIKPSQIQDNVTPIYRSVTDRDEFGIASNRYNELVGYRYKGLEIKNDSEVGKILNKTKKINEDVYSSNLVPNYRKVSLAAMNNNDKNLLRVELQGAFNHMLNNKKETALQVKDIKILDTDLMGKVTVSLPGMNETQVQKMYPKAKGKDGIFTIEDPRFNLMNDTGGMNVVLSSRIENIRQDLQKNPIKYQDPLTGQTKTEIEIMSGYHGYTIYVTPALINNGGVWTKDSSGKKQYISNLSKAIEGITYSSKLK